VEEPAGTGALSHADHDRSGQPRRQGNTAKVLGWIAEQFRADGHEVDRADILDHQV
jgi:hypothetical protein